MKFKKCKFNLFPIKNYRKLRIDINFLQVADYMKNGDLGTELAGMNVFSAGIILTYMIQE